MSTASELIYVVGAILIFGVASLNFNRMYVMHTMETVKSVQSESAVRLANDIIQEARVKAFDQNTIDSIVDNLSDLTPSNNFGPDTGESLRIHFNDFDDFHGFTQTFSDETGTYNISVDVCYVISLIDELCVSGQTNFKKMNVLVEYNDPSGNGSVPMTISYVKGLF
jgi:hypothetical protein